MDQTLPLSALPGWAVDAHVLSIIQQMMSLMGENETVQSLGVTNWRDFKKMNYMNVFFLAQRIILDYEIIQSIVFGHSLYFKHDSRYSAYIID